MKYILFLLSLSLAACTTMKMSDGGRQVRVINSSVAAVQHCAHLGMVSGWGPYLSGGMPYAQVQVRNRVAEKGGNALVIASQSVTGPGHGEVVGDAYRCSF